MNDTIIVATDDTAKASRIADYFSARADEVLIAKDSKDLLTTSCTNDVKWIIVDGDLAGSNGLMTIHFCKKYRPSILSVLLISDTSHINSAQELSEADIVINGLITDNKLTSLASLMANTRLNSCTYEMHRRIISWTYLRFTDSISTVSQMNSSAVNFAFQTHFKNGAFRTISFRLSIKDNRSIIDSLSHFDRLTERIEQRLSPLCFEILTQFQYCNSTFVINYDEQLDSRIRLIMEEEFTKAIQIQSQGYSCYMFVSNIYGDMSDIQYMKDETRNSAWLRLTLGTQKEIIYGSSLGKCPEEKKKLLDDLQQSIINSIVGGNKRVFAENLDVLCNQPESVLRFPEARKVFRQIEYLLIQTAADKQPDMANPLQKQQKMRTAMSPTNTLYEYIPILKRQLMNLMLQITDLPESTHSKHIEEGRQFIMRNCSNPVLNLETVSSHLELNPFYFSHLFKKEMNCTFSQFLNECRVNQAKDLLRNSDIRISAIALSVGYSDVHYFGKVFRSLTGKTPAEYRKEIQDSTTGIKLV